MHDTSTIRNQADADLTEASRHCKLLAVTFSENRILVDLGGRYRGYVTIDRRESGPRSILCPGSRRR